MSEPTSKVTVQNAVTDTARIIVYSELNASTRAIPWSVFKSDISVGDDSIIDVFASQAIITFNTFYFVNASAAALTMSLGTAVNNKGKWVFFKKVDSSINTVTLDPSGSEVIDLDASLVLSAANAFVRITSDGANWKITNA